MGEKHKKEVVEDHSSDQDFEGEDDELDIEEQIINKIKELPTLKDKVHCIAVNHYMDQKRKLDESLQKDVEQIEQKFRAQFNPFISEINKIISGEHEFTDADFEGSSEILTGEQLAVKNNYTSKKESIPEYWLKAFITSEIVGEQVHEIDEPLLKHLIKVEAQKSEDLKKFSVYFYFSENEWFTNAKVAKHFDIEQTEIKRAYGDDINWKQGKNITVKTVKKKSKKGGKKTKEVKQQSFFNLFKQVDNSTSDEQNNDAESQNDEDEVEELERQYQLCENIYEEVIPKSLQFYLGIVQQMGECCGDEECTDMACHQKGGKKGNNDSDEQ